MKKIMNTLKTTIAALLLTMGGQATADYNDYNSYNSYQEPNDSLFPCSWCINDGFIRGDLLYLRAFEDGLSNPFEPSTTLNAHYSSSSTESSSDSSNSSSGNLSLTTGKGREPKFRWDLGYRLGAGVNFMNCEWNIAAYWTHFSPDATKHTNERPRWKLDYDTVDVLIGYKCEINKCFIIDAFGGLRAAQINQRIHGNFVNWIDTETGNFASVIDKKTKQDFEGVGFIFGLKGEFKLDCGITFFLAGDTGTLVGRNKLHLEYANYTHLRNTFGARYKRHQEACQYFVDSNIGVRWQTCIYDSMKLILELGYESHNYFNHNRMNDEGNLYINGGNLSAALVY